jgi:multidrug efflux pump subunit AcrA (membrane-fusion protein)
MLKKQLKYMLLWLLVGWLTSCNNAPPEETIGASAAQTPVTVCLIGHDTLREYVEVNATSSFLLKNFVKANANGYLHSSSIHLGQQVQQGQILFTVTTKEAQSLGNTLNKLDTSFRFSGINSIKAGSNGFITQLDHQTGDYVMDGEQLAVISDRSSFVFIMNIPYELHALVVNQKTVTIVLPDSELLQGTITSSLPQMDSISQTERITLHVGLSDRSIPEYLIAKVRVPKRSSLNAITVPKAALLTDETQSEFWIMKMSDNNTAVKIPVKKGIETADKVEILSPVLNDHDRILISGQYGLEDSAKVKIIIEQHK